MRTTNHENIPLFPNFDLEEIEDNVLVFKTIIYIHKDSENVVKVYSYLVENCYIAKNKQELNLVSRAHFRECFRLSKYLNIKSLDTTTLPLVNILDKRADDFLHKVHYIYT